MHLITASNDEKAQLAFRNGSQCSNWFVEGNVAYQACVRDVLSPSFGMDHNLIAIGPLVEEMTQFATVMAGITAGMLCTISLVCSVLALSIVPEGEAFLPWIVLGNISVGAMAGARLNSILEAASVDAEAAEAALAQEVRNLTKLTDTCPTAARAMVASGEDPCLPLMDHIALGLESAGLEKFSENVKARNLMSLDQEAWRGEVWKIGMLMKDFPGQYRVSFMLDGMEGFDQGVAAVV